MTTHNTQHGVATITKFTAFLIMFAVLVGVPGQAFAAVNLITNGDLETPDGSNANLPAGWLTGHSFAGATTTYQYPVSGVTGNGALVSIESATPGADAKWYFAQVPVTQGKEYQFTNKYISTSPTEIVIEYFDASNQHLSYGGFYPIAPSGVDTWADTNVVFTAPTGAAYATVFHTIQNGVLTVDDYSLIRISPADPVVFNKGIVSFSFDDGWASQFTNAVPVMNANNIEGSFYIISGAMTRPGDGYATSSMLIAAQSQGHELGAHTVNHCNLATGLCPDGNPADVPDALTVTQEVADSRDALAAIGASPVDTFVYPYGAFTAPDTTDIVAAQGFIGARTTQEGYNNKDSNLYTLKTYIVDRTITEGAISRVQNWVDTAIQNKEWLILSFHQVDDAAAIALHNESGATTPEFFAQIVDYVKQKRDTDQVVVRNVHDVLSLCMSADESQCVNKVIIPADTTAPVITIDSYTTTPTNQDVVVTAHTNEGTLNATTHTFTANGSFNFVATDTAGNVATSTVTITNIDKTAPVITPAANVTAEATSVSGAVVTYSSPVSTDPIVCTPGSGTLFALGTTSVNCTSTDTAGNTSTASFMVIVQDTTAPVITIDSYTTTPTNQDVVVTAHTNEGTLNVSSHTFSANGSFGFTATDASGNLTATTVTITNIDKTAPVITPAANVTAEAMSSLGTNVTYALPPSTDPIVCTPGSGTLFALGTTSVNCTSTDTAGNTSTASFMVIVQDTTAPVITLIGTQPQGIELGAPYIEQGATATDTVSGDRTASIIINASGVNTNVAGSYVVTYNVVDTAGNAAPTQIRIVQVAQRTLGIVANPRTKVYGTIDPVLTYTLATGTLLVGDVFTGSLTRTQGEATGTYPISLGSLTAGPNYALNFAGANLTIVSPTCTNGRVLRGNECIKPNTSGSKRRTTAISPTPSVLGVSTTTSSTTPATKFIFVSTLQMVSQGTEVTELQKRLTTEKVYTGPITGYFGALTKAAVIVYQTLHGIDPVGVVGPKTRAELNK